MRTYHVGLIKGTGNTPYWANGHRASTLVVQARRSVDYMSCELWEYLGERETTKAQLKRNATEILRQVNQKHGTHFTHVVID